MKAFTMAKGGSDAILRIRQFGAMANPNVTPHNL